jgi:hypothetical protein
MVSSGNRHLRCAPVFAAVLVALVCVWVLRTVPLRVGEENDWDVFYHVRLAELGPSVFLARTFPWTTMSVWRTAYYDKELLFHGALWVIRGIQRYVGSSLAPPFVAPHLIFCGLLLTVFVAVLAALGCRDMTLMMAALVLVLGCPAFTARLLLLRPHLLSISVLLVFFWWCSNRSRPAAGIPAILFGMLMVYTYSNPHFILLPAIAWAIVWAHDRRRLATLLPLPGTIALGLFLGMLVHPQVPNTFHLWKIQCVDVVRQILAPATSVHIGAELGAPRLLWVRANWAVVAGLLGVVFLTTRAQQREIALARESRAAILCLCGLAFGLVFSARVIEYYYVFLLLTLALLLRDSKLEGTSVGSTPGACWTRWLPIGMAAMWLASAGGQVLTQGLGGRLLRTTTALDDFAAWAKRELPTPTTIANPCWADFPMLFYSLPEYRFSLGIEPMFAYHANPQAVATLEQFRTGRIQLAPAQLAALTGARLAFVSRHAALLARRLLTQGYNALYAGPDGWLFELGEAAAPLPVGPRRASVAWPQYRTDAKKGDP